MRGMVLAAAVAGFITTSSVAYAQTATDTGMIHCGGVNSCKGQSACKTANNACKGQNSCKGQGILIMSQADCQNKGGTVE